MSLPLIILAEAQEDLDVITAKYVAENPKVADRFVRQFRRHVSLIQDFPYLYGKIFRSVRAVKVRKFPYIAYYRVQRNCLVLIAVCHVREENRIHKLRR